MAADRRPWNQRECEVSLVFVGSQCDLGARYSDLKGRNRKTAGLSLYKKRSRGQLLEREMPRRVGDRRESAWAAQRNSRPSHGLARHPVDHAAVDGTFARTHHKWT